MQRLTRMWGGAAALAVTLGACGPEKNETTESPTGSSSTDPSGTTAPATTADAPTTTAVTTDDTGSGGASESTGTTTGMSGICLGDVPADVEQTCTSETDELSCISWEFGPGVGGCVWIPWFPTRIMDGQCSFGDPRGQCAFVRCQEEGCAELSPCGPEGFGGAFIEGDNDVISVGFADWCLGPPAPAMPCIFDFEGELVEGPPECACLCSPDFPGS